ncbi:phenazine-specific anthranilate synthase component I [Kibdelosporangium aridum]|uniref:anthranilate synthase n=1 Tax=Kibdelosporangium aridum TaxID=2030 RepID=A0A428YCF8_KIBAR|nr:chorismate-binding protein [Kibdelosporangium aridum]RSM65254.1 phenazine-specific anthranilate synthase component I [Kibdelosporangium aridum]
MTAKHTDGGLLLHDLLSRPSPPFALLHRPESGAKDRLEVITGPVREVRSLAEIPVDDGQPGHQTLVMLPYRQLTERGFACQDDAAPILAMTIAQYGDVDLAEAAGMLPDSKIERQSGAFDIGDEEYAEIVRRVIADEVGTGAGSNFVIKRSYVTVIPDYSVTTALALFRRLLAAETGAYWTFLVHTGTRTFIGATPERHVSLESGTVVMNPISGTYRYPPEGPTLSGVLDFLADPKETDELCMVVDEELKMMARVCPAGGQVVGPFLKQMTHLAHTEYLLTGTGTPDVRDVLRETMFAPTVVGSPLENACRVVARHEPHGRGYYSGVLGLIGVDSDGQSRLDSAILIRTAQIDGGGRLSLGVGATLVRHSVPAAEVAETWSKAAGLLAALGIEAGPARGEPAEHRALSGHPSVQAALAARNDRLAPFWLDDPRQRAARMAQFAGRSALVIDAEDTFTAMLATQLRALGLAVRIVPHDRCLSELDPPDLVVLGPGPGDPEDLSEPKMVTLRQAADRLLRGDKPLLAICAVRIKIAESKRDCPSLSTPMRPSTPL